MFGDLSDSKPLTDKVSRKCQPQDGDSEFKKQMKKAISDDLNKRYQDQSVGEYLLKCKALDPRTKARNVVGDESWEGLVVEVSELMVSFRYIIFYHIKAFYKV